MYLYRFNVYMFLKGWNISRLGQDPSHRLSGTLVFFRSSLSLCLSTCIPYRIMHWVCLQIHQPCWWGQPVSVRLRYAGSPPDIHTRLLRQLSPWMKFKYFFILSLCSAIEMAFSKVIFSLFHASIVIRTLPHFSSESTRFGSTMSFFVTSGPGF